MHRVSGFGYLGSPSEDGSVTDWKQRDSRKVQVVLAPPPCFNDELSDNSHQSELTCQCIHPPALFSPLLLKLNSCLPCMRHKYIRRCSTAVPDSSSIQVPDIEVPRYIRGIWMVPVGVESNQLVQFNAQPANSSKNRIKVF